MRCLLRKSNERASLNNYKIGEQPWLKQKYSVAPACVAR
ncbi:hypothetical protein SAMN04490179_2396 [Pseudomonas antarctica]|uniref:Uncharacterized protein n=1 Tax=Pseudomonas antarctica TaxID=219572 RepID=A0A1G9YG78_9PSED|nr:hypothetical protein PSAN_29830 [Pseudomonas antarctica]SDN07972.1 hypothetical protein SAMN04490179_2396 [Pseudomonas antarctica]